MKALLVQPRVPWPYRLYWTANFMPPMALGYLAAVLREKDVATEVLDLNVVPATSRSDFAELLAGEQFDLVGVSTSTETITNCYTICQLAKEARADTCTVLGGSHATFRPLEALATGAVDYVVMGEGEITLAELVDHLQEGKPDRRSIDGLAYLEDGQSLVNRPRAVVDDLDSLPRPARELLHLDRYGNPGAVVGSRGCPNSCIFCSAGAMAGGKYRVHEVAGIVDEIEALVREYGAKQILFSDNTLTVMPRRVEELCHQLRERNLQVTWFCESRVDVVSPELLRTMAEGGCYSIQFGLESGSQLLLDACHKRTALEQVQRAVTACTQAGIVPVLSYMIGHPEETVDTIQATKSFTLDMRRLGATLIPAVMVPFPGTPINERAEEYGIEIVAESWNDYQMGNATMNTRHFQAEEIRTHFFDLIVQSSQEEPAPNQPPRPWPLPWSMSDPAAGAAFGHDRFRC